jgi:hypothetical protein
MKSLSELAAIYEGWATANEMRAEGILASADSLVDEFQEQRERASQLMAEALALRTRAGDLRKLHLDMLEALRDVCRIPEVLILK